MVVLDGGLRLLDERRVPHARRARGLARHAPQARVEVPDDRVRYRDSPFAPRLHQDDAPARRVHLLSEQQITWTRGETEPAVNAGVGERPQWFERGKGVHQKLEIGDWKL